MLSDQSNARVSPTADPFGYALDAYMRGVDDGRAMMRAELESSLDAALKSITRFTPEVALLRAVLGAAWDEVPA